MLSVFSFSNIYMLCARFGTENMKKQTQETDTHMTYTTQRGGSFFRRGGAAGAKARAAGVSDEGGVAGTLEKCLCHGGCLRVGWVGPRPSRRE